MPILPGVGAAMLAFAANSVLCRMALGGAAIDAASFTVLRLCSGAVTLAAVLLWQRSAQAQRTPVRLDIVASLMLFAYALCFAFAYLELSTASGALILFGVVQLTMVMAGFIKGERPPAVAWVGMGLALAGLVYLLLPGVTTPSLNGALLMTLAGLAWGLYSLRGKRASDPIAATTWNFILTLPLALLTGLIFWGDMHLSFSGILLALASGALASGLGYVIWYAVLPRLTSSRAATAQLSVPVLASAGGVVLLDEVFTTRLAIAGIAVLGGIGLTIAAKNKRGKGSTGVVRP